MRKSLIKTTGVAATPPATQKDSWLDLDAITTIEITSEDPAFPIEHALVADASDGWRAAAKGPQVIRLKFDQPTTIHRIHLHFSDPTTERSQEFAIYAHSQNSGGEAGGLREVLRQQFTFSSGGSTEEIENYTVGLQAITTFELRIDPDRAHDPTHSQHYAVLKSLRLA